MKSISEAERKMADREKLLEDLAIEIKSVVMPSQKGVPITSLLRDYKMLIGKGIPFRALGYSSLEDLLRAMPAFIRLENRFGGEIIVTAVPDQATAHIHSLISRQRVSKQRTSMKPKRKPMSSFNSWKPQHSPKQKYYQSPQLYHGQHKVSSTIRTVTQTQGNNPPRNVQPIGIFKQQKYEVPPRFSNPKPWPSDDQQENQKPQNSKNYEQFIEVKTNTLDKAERKLINYNYVIEADTDFVESANVPKYPSFPTSLAKNSVNAITKGSTAFYENNANNIPLINNINDLSGFTITTDGNRRRILGRKSIDNSPLSSSSFEVDSSVPNERKNSSEIPESPVWHHITPERVVSPEIPVAPSRAISDNPMDLVALYAQLRGTKPLYKTVPIINKKRKTPKYLSTLTLLEEKFQSYPDEKPTAAEANEQAARNAVAKLNITPESVYIILPVTPASTDAEVETLISRITDIVFPKTNGIWHANVKHMYEEIHKETLPEDWLSLVRSCPALKIESVVHNLDKEKVRYILYPHVGRESPEQFSCITTSSEHRSISIDGSSSSLPEPIQLPEGYWDVFVKYVKSSTYVAINLIESYDNLTALQGEMYDFYSNNSSPIEEAVVGETYAIFCQETWERVQVTEFYDDDEVLCYFVDYGDSEKTKVSNLIELQKQFLELPFQAIICELSGLEYFSNDDEVTTKLIDSLQGKTFVAESTKSEDTITLTLFDTSTDEDINMNQLFFDYVCQEVMIPKLPKAGKMCMAQLSLINDNGDLLLGLVSPKGEIIKQMFNDIQAQLLEQKGTIKTLSPSKTYAVQCSDGTWRRALLIADNLTNDKMVTVSHMDYGTTEQVAIDDLCELENISEFLVKLPFQVVTCRLSNVPMDEDSFWTNAASQRLKDLVPQDALLHLKVITEKMDGRQATVELFNRIDNKGLISINQTLATEPSLFRSEVGLSTVLNKRPIKFPSKSRIPNELPKLTMPSAEANLQRAFQNLSTAENGIKPALPSIKYLSAESEFTIPVPEIPNVSDQFDVTVSLATNPEEMIVQDFHQKQELIKLVREMKQFYSSEENILEMDPCLLIPGKYFALKHSSGPNWFRALLKMTSGLIAVMYLIDYGEFQTAEMSRLQPLYHSFRHLPYQAIRASLAGVAPVGASWTTDDACFFQKLVIGKPFVSIIREKKLEQSPDNVKSVSLSLTLIDTSTDQDIYIDKLLFEKNIAKPSL